MTLLTESVEKLVQSRKRYVVDALWDSADRFEQLSDGGTDSYYAEPALQWRFLSSRVESKNQSGFDEPELQKIAAGILWYELNN